MPRDGGAVGSGFVRVRRGKRVVVDCREAYDAVLPWLVELLEGSTRGQREDEVRRTADLVLGAATRAAALNGTRRRVQTGMSRREHSRVLESLDLEPYRGGVARPAELRIMVA